MGRIEAGLSEGNKPGQHFLIGEFGMIFVTVGTHEQPFNRLIEYVDRLRENGTISEDVIMQTGFSTYEPKYCEWQKLFPYKEMVKKVEEARIVITHGGPSSFIMPLQIGKIPVVVPRRKKYNEHVNDHQLIFVKALAERQGNLLVVEDIEDLKNMLVHYNEMIASIPTEMKSNNARFNERIGSIVDEMFN